MIFRQFSITLVTAMALSVLVAIFFTPALCATLLRPRKPGQGARAASSAGSTAASSRQSRLCARCGRRPAAPLRMMAIYVALLAGLGVMFLRLPGALPAQ